MAMLTRVLTLTALTCIIAYMPNAVASEQGAIIFSQRCVLCHGSQGMGEGPLPMSLKNYPSANLLHGTIQQTRSDVLNTITNGSNKTEFMPPWKDELSKEEINQVTDFVMLLRDDLSQGLKTLKQIEEKKAKSISDGKIVYETRCILCHGKTGLGDGRMSRVVKNPPPFNLTKSLMPPAYLKSIIQNGGEPLGRSKQMPPWKDQLNDKEVDAVIQFILTLRK